MRLKILHIEQVQNSGITTPEMVNFDHIGLFKKKFTTKGVIDKIEYYEGFANQEVYENLILSSEFIYGYSNNIYTDVTNIIKWYNLEGVVGHERTFFKKFLPWESVEFAVQRRNNIIGNLKIFVLAHVGLVNGFDLLSAVSTEINLYCQGINDLLPAKLQSLVQDKSYLSQSLVDNINLMLIIE